MTLLPNFPTVESWWFGCQQVTVEGGRSPVKLVVSTKLTKWPWPSLLSLTLLPPNSPLFYFLKAELIDGEDLAVLTPPEVEGLW